MYQPYSNDPSKAMAFEKDPGISLYSFRLRPESEGSVKITTADPAAPLAIDPRYLVEESDRRAAIGATRYIRELMSQPALSSYVVGEVGPTAAAQTDDEIIAYYHQRGQAGYHATATVKMGQDNAAPLDGELRLRGVKGLRVCDLSIFPEMIAGNTNAPTMAMASRASALILADRAN
jgi:choline dehydrogenase-like flavoprotein